MAIDIAKLFTRVVSRKKGETGYVNCTRGTLFGNPFPLKYYTRPIVLLHYKKYLDWRVSWDRVFKNELQKLFLRACHEYGITLGCTCKEDSACHVDILIEKIIELFGQDIRYCCNCDIVMRQSENSFYRCIRCGFETNSAIYRYDQNEREKKDLF